MEIKRKFDLLIETKRRYVIRQSPARPQTDCAECGELMIGVEQAAVFFAIKQRRIFQLVESEAAHFVENETGAAMVCLSSLAAILGNEERNNQPSLLNKTAVTDY